MKRFLFCERGQAVVEFVISFPLILIFLGGILQGVLLANANFLTHYAAFQAARVGMLFEMNSPLRRDPSKASQFIDAQQEIMEKAALACLVPVRYRTRDATTLAEGIALAHLGISPGSISNLSLPSIGDLDVSSLTASTIQSLLNSLLSSIVSSILGGGMGGLSDLDSALPGDLLGGLTGQLENLASISDGGIGSVMAGLSGPTFVTVTRKSGIDPDSPDFSVSDLDTDYYNRLSDQPDGPNRHLTVELVHQFRLDIPVINVLLYHGVRLAYYGYEGTFSSVPASGELTIPIRAYYTISLPFHPLESSNGTIYAENDDSLSYY